MKICNKCGTANQDNTFFCAACKVRLGLSQEELEKKQQSQNETFEVFKSVGASPLMLALILINVLSIACSVYAFLHLKDIVSNYPGIPLDLFTQTIFITTIAGVVLSIPSVLAFIGFLMLYSSSIKATNSISTGGLSLIKGASIFNMVLLCLFVAVCAFALIASPTTVEFIIMLIFIVFLIFGIVYFAKVIKATDSIIFAINTKSPTLEISTFIIVMNYIIAGIIVINMVWSKQFELQGMLSATMSVLTAVLLTSLKTKIRRLQERKAYESFQSRVKPTYVVMEEQSVASAPLYKATLPNIQQNIPQGGSDYEESESLENSQNEE